MSENEKSTIGHVLGRTPSGVFILVVGDGQGRTTGMLASWVQQASFDPPMVTIAVNRKRYLNGWLEDAPDVVLNLVGVTQTMFIKHFGSGFEPDENAFEGISVSTADSGLPVLNEAIGHLVGHVVSKFETGDHVVYAVEIDAAGTGPTLETEKPFVHIRKNGFSY